MRKAKVTLARKLAMVLHRTFLDGLHFIAVRATAVTRGKKESAYHWVLHKARPEEAWPAEVELSEFLWLRLSIFFRPPTDTMGRRFARVQHQQRLKSIGTVTSAIAHC
ncbi:hypothetical protein JMJ56_32625 [Belnapia sp. T18]|uniref:Uncharacterized protein n=1 Tax=Belnapia arida TaxID=2804533 RepID=A0ABS1UEV3_9PROT|nr:hypothetical protein [Belnapia arida]